MNMWWKECFHVHMPPFLIIRTKVRCLISHQLSIWSSPWCPIWSSIYDHLIIQHQPYIYPSNLKDLWKPNNKAWNENLIYSLFDAEAASIILQTPIIQTEGKDIMCWKHTPTGKCTTKSAYKLCVQVLHQE